MPSLFPYLRIFKKRQTPVTDDIERAVDDVAERLLQLVGVRVAELVVVENGFQTLHTFLICRVVVVGINAVKLYHLSEAVRTRGYRLVHHGIDYATFVLLSQITTFRQHSPFKQTFSLEVGFVEIKKQHVHFLLVFVIQAAIMIMSGCVPLAYLFIRLV